jgi:hypothetical protein
MNTEDTSNSGVGAALALAISATYLAAHEDSELVVESLKILDADSEEGKQARFCTYGAPDDFPAGCWVVYVSRQRPFLMITSSEIVGICKRSTRIVYLG